MTEKRCLLAHTTLAQSYPAYVNISQHDNGDVEVTVRSAGYPDGRGNTVCGQEASIRMTAADFQREWLGVAKSFRA